MLVSVLVALILQPSPAMLRRLFEEALVRRKAEYGDSHVRTAQAARDVGLFLSKQGDQPGARAALAEAVRIDEKALGPKHPQTLADVAELASLSAASQAEPLWQRAAGSPNAEVSSRALAALAGLRENSGDRAGAAVFYRQALAKEEAASGRESARVAVRLNALARVVDLPEGIALLERALAINRGRLGPRHLETATINANLAGLLLQAGRTDEAARFSRDAISIFEENPDANDPRTAVAVTLLAHALRANGDTAGAERMYRRALSINERAYGPRHAQARSDARTLAGFLREIGKDREAAELEKRLLNDAR